MSAAKGPRLWLRPAREGRAAVYLIRDGERQVSTLCGPRDLESATRKLAAYIAAKHRPEDSRGKPLTQVPVADVLALYSVDVAEKRKRPEANRARLRRLLAFFADNTLAEVNGRLTRAYTAQRRSEQAARRELEDLRAAINHWFREDAVAPRINIELPDKALPRERWLTEREAAKLLWTAWRRSQPMPKGGRRYVSRHIARFALVGLYTGTRSAAICGAAIRPTEGRGYVDLERGVFHRRPPGTRETMKRQPPVRLPDKLLNHLRRWARLGLCEHSIVEWEGEPVARVAKGFRQVAVAAGFPDVTPHTLRHTAVTWSKQRGTPSYIAADYFGMSERMIEKVYGHHDPAHHAEVTTRMDRRPVAPPVADKNRRSGIP